MKKNIFKICFIIIFSSFLFSGCTSNKSAQKESTNKNITSSGSGTSSESSALPKTLPITSTDPLNCIYNNTPIIIKDSLYFLNQEDNMKIYSIPTSSLGSQIDSTKSLKVCDDATFSIASDSTYIYFINYSSNNGLYKISLDGKDKVQLFNTHCSNLSLFGDSIYYINKDDNNRLYRYSIPQNTSYKITENQVTLYTVCNDYIVYINGNDNYKIYGINSSGEENTKITDYSTSSFCICNNMLYYCNSSDKNYIYSSKLDGSQGLKLTSFPCENLSCDKNNLYLVKKDDLNNLYKLSFDGKTLNKISTEITASYSILDKYILIHKRLDNKTLVIAKP